MRANIIELLEIQREVNREVNKKLKTFPDGADYMLAFNIELFEYFNAIGFWKWWKHNHIVNREKVLDELADCFAFFLSLIDYQNELEIHSEREEILEKVEEEINRYLDFYKKFEENIKEEMTTEEIIKDLILYIGIDNEIEGVFTIERFSIAIYIATILFEGITWDEITAAYKKKSKINIERQEQNY